MVGKENKRKVPLSITEDVGTEATTEQLANQVTYFTARIGYSVLRERYMLSVGTTVFLWFTFKMKN